MATATEHTRIDRRLAPWGRERATAAARALSVLLGLWVLVAPDVLAYPSAVSTWIARVLGGAALVLALADLVRSSAWASGGAGVAGVALLASVVVDHGAAAAVNHALSGGALALLATVAARSSARRAAVDPARGPSRVRPVVRAGLIAGLAGGLLMAAWAMVHSAARGGGLLLPLRVLGTTVAGERALVLGPTGPILGLAIHLSLAMVLGVVFAAAIGRHTPTRLALPAGLLYGLLLFFLAVAAVLPVVNPSAAVEARHVPSSWLVGHLLYGVGVALAPALRRRAAADPLAGG